MSDLRIEIVKEVTDDLVVALQHLIPQLTESEINITEDSVMSILSAGNTHLFVAKDASGRVLGTLTLVIFTIPTSKKAFIEDVIVDSSAQGLGAGRALVKAAIELATDLRAQKIELSSNPQRIAANALYQKIGFKRRDTNFYRLEL